MPLYIGYVISAIQNRDFDDVGPLCIQLALIVLGSGIAVAFRSGIINILSERIAYVMRHDYFESVVNKDIAFFDTRRTGDLRKYSCIIL